MKNTAPKKTKQTTALVPKATNIYDALFSFQSEKISIPRNGRGKSKEGKEYKYATLDDILMMTHEALQKNGLVCSQTIENSNLKTTLFAINATGDPKHIETSIPLGNPTSAQDMGARITYMRRYAIVPMLGLSIEDDTDAVPPELTPPNVGEVKTIVPPTDLRDAKDLITLKPAVERTPSFQKAWGAVQSADSEAAIDLVKGQIQRSTRVTDAEKIELLAELTRRDSEINGTIQA